MSLLCLVPFAQAHGGMGESRSLLRMMAWHVREVGLHRQSMVDRLEPGDVDPAVFGMFRYMDTYVFFSLSTAFHPSLARAEQCPAPADSLGVPIVKSRNTNPVAKA